MFVAVDKHHSGSDFDVIKTRLKLGLQTLELFWFFMCIKSNPTFALFDA